jgi:hypothetical protein
MVVWVRASTAWGLLGDASQSVVFRTSDCRGLQYGPDLPAHRNAIQDVH